MARQQSQQQRWLTTEQAAALAGVKPDTLRRYGADGQAPAPERFGRSLRWDRVALEEWLQRRAGQGARSDLTVAASIFRHRLVRLGPGRYVQVSDDRTSAWLIFSYPETGDSRTSKDVPLIGTFWAAAMVPEHVDLLTRDSRGRISAVVSAAELTDWWLWREVETSGHRRRIDVLVALGLDRGEASLRPQAATWARTRNTT